MSEKPDLRIDYVEFPATDMEATKAFYSAAFGWSFVDYGPDYVAIQGAYLDGGFDLSAAVAPKLGKEGHGEKLRVTAGVLIVLYAADLEKSLEAVKSAGGVISKGIFSFPGGRRFHFLDPNGNELAIWSE
jgi:predicted enzyme related to lactoylglutathione lyase